MRMVAENEDEYIPMQPLDDPDYEANAGLDISEYNDGKAETKEMQAKEIKTSDEHEYLEVIGL